MSYVLVVDDKEENRYYLQALLTGHGYRVTTARHGAEALVLARQSSPTLIISDLLMPVMDGYTLLRHWKADPALRALPFIVYTATYTQAEDEKLAMDLGADAFILKPAEPDEFLTRMHDVLSRPASAGPHASGPERSNETEVLRHYSETLIRKLEEKSLQLSEANRVLELDIVRREKAEAALRDSEERFRLLASATNDVIWDWDIQKGTHWWGDGFADLFGHTNDDLLRNRQLWTNLIHPDDRGRVLSSLQSAIKKGGNWHASYRLRRADGSWASVEDRAQLIRNEQGSAVRMVGGLSDVSERAALEERLRNSQRLEAVGQLTGGIAHDFNNLLTIVLGNAETLAEVLVDDTQKRELARMIIGAAERGAELTQRLLAFARKQSLSPCAVDLNKLLLGLNLMLDRVLGSTIVLVFNPAKNLPAAMVDASQLEHSVLNLCVNARDAMAGGGTLTVASDQVIFEQDFQCNGHWVPEGAYVRLQVSDTGCGIPPENMTRIFEPFFSTKQEGKGAGLGLAMVYGFVRQSGGHIVVESEQNRGTTFSLYLPQAEEKAIEPAAPGRSADMPGGSDCILLVEDDVLVRQIAQHNLESLGYRVIAASGGESALSILTAMRARGEKVDLLFTDVQMAGMNGPDLVVQADVLQPGVRVLYTSGYTPELAVKGRLPGSDWPILGKPYRRAELAAHIATALRHQ
ncbi:MAG: response regulator [Pseudohongiella sp.]|nr:response regulator [Pseudohongiella sp.]